MVLATLIESEVTVSDDIVESIVEKALNHMKPYIYPPSISIVSSVSFFSLILLSWPDLF